MRHTQIHPFHPQTAQGHSAVGPGSESLRGKAVFVACGFYAPGRCFLLSWRLEGKGGWPCTMAGLELAD